MEEIGHPDGVKAICERIRKAFEVLSQCPLITIFAGSDEAFYEYHQANLAARQRYASLSGAKGNPGKPLTSVRARDKENVAVAAKVPLAECELCITRDWDCAAPEDWYVAASLITGSFLWDEVRVKGGAYGATFRGTEKQITFSSHADPHIAETFDAFRRAADWLANIELTEEELVGCKLSCLARYDAPEPLLYAEHNQAGDLLSGENPAFYAMRRQMILDTTVESLREQGKLLQELMKDAAYGVTASREAIEASGMDFHVYEF